MNKKVFSAVIAVVLSAVAMVPQAEARVEVVVNVGNPVVVMPVSPPPPVVVVPPPRCKKALPPPPSCRDCLRHAHKHHHKKHRPHARGEKLPKHHRHHK